MNDYENRGFILQMTDIVLSEFVSSTGVEPAVAQDILDSHEWDLQAALRAYSSLKTARSLNNNGIGIVPDISSPKRVKDTLPLNMEVARVVPVGRPLLKKNDAVEVSDETTGTVLSTKFQCFFVGNCDVIKKADLLTPPQSV